MTAKTASPEDSITSVEQLTPHHVSLLHDGRTLPMIDENLCRTDRDYCVLPFDTLRMFKRLALISLSPHDHDWWQLTDRGRAFIDAHPRPAPPKSRRPKMPTKWDESQKGKWCWWREEKVPGKEQKPAHRQRQGDGIIGLCNASVHGADYLGPEDMPTTYDPDTWCQACQFMFQQPDHGSIKEKAERLEREVAEANIKLGKLTIERNEALSEAHRLEVQNRRLERESYDRNNAELSRVANLGQRVQDRDELARLRDSESTWQDLAQDVVKARAANARAVSAPLSDAIDALNDHLTKQKKAKTS